MSTDKEPKPRPAEGSVLDLVQHYRRAAEAGAYMAALITALTIPDICGAMAADNGRASKSKYIAWLTEWFKLNSMTPDPLDIKADHADAIYGFRCSLLHQGSAHPHGDHPPIAFIEPTTDAFVLHNLVTVAGDDEVFWLSIPFFLEEMAHAAEAWWVADGATDRVQRNFERYARLRPEGLPPHVSGSPVVA